MKERTLQEFRGMEGPYGVLTMIAKGSEKLELRLTSEFVRLTREDAHEMKRQISVWLAGLRDTQVVRTHGADSDVVIVDDGPGSPSVDVNDDDDAPRPRGGDRHYSTHDEDEPRRSPT